MVIKLNVNGNNMDFAIQSEVLCNAVTAVMLDKNNYTENLVVINPYTKEKIDVILGDENRVLVPAHNKEDYKLALEHNIQIKQVAAPYFLGEGEETLREDKKTQERHSVIFVVKHHKEDKYICLDCKNRNCKSFVLGGIEDGESVQDAALRELKEETGYVDCKIDFVSNFQIVNHFYAGYKGVNRFAYLAIVFGTLVTEENIGMSEEENAKHTVNWIRKENLESYITVNNNKYALDILLHGEKPVEGKAIAICPGKYNKKIIEINS